MILTEKETTIIKDLQTQEKSCVEKYKRYKEEARDGELKELFTNIEEQERKHLETLTKVLNGDVPCCDCNDSKGKEYNPKGNYADITDSEDKKKDCFLATDCIGTEKLVSGEYNSDVFVFGEPAVRKVLADIQIEEQNHAEMLYKYKQVNKMA